MESEYSGNLESVRGINNILYHQQWLILNCGVLPAVAVPQPRPPGFPYCTFTPRHNPPVGRSPPVVPAASRPFSVFPPFIGTQTVPRPIASPPSGDPVIPVENLIDTSVSLNVTPNQTEFRAWINGRVHQSFGMKDTMVHYISRLLDVAKYTVADLQDLKLLKYDPKDHEQDPGDRQPLYYYLLRIPGFRRRAKIADHLPPAPQRANQALNLEAIEHVMISHTSNPGGASGILKEARIAPSRLHVPDSNSFFSLGARKTGNLEWDMKEFARIIHNTWFLSKQQCSLVFVGTAWGTAVAVKEGGEHACCDLTRNGGTVHHQRAKMWVTNTNSHILTAIAFPVTALPPTWFFVMCFCVFGLFPHWMVSYTKQPPQVFQKCFKLFVKICSNCCLWERRHHKTTPRPGVHHLNLMVQCMSSEDTQYVRAKHWVMRLRLWCFHASCPWKQCSPNQNAAWTVSEIKIYLTYMLMFAQMFTLWSFHPPYTLWMNQFEKIRDSHSWCPTAFDFRS